MVRREPGLADQTLDPGSRIEDPCLGAPIPVEALLDAAAAKRAVVEALAAQGEPTLRQREAAVRSEGEAMGVARALLKMLAGRGLAVSDEQRQEILSCRDLDRLERGIERAFEATSATEVLAEE